MISVCHKAAWGSCLSPRAPRNSRLFSSSRVCKASLHSASSRPLAATPRFPQKHAASRNPPNPFETPTHPRASRGEGEQQPVNWVKVCPKLENGHTVNANREITLIGPVYNPVTGRNFYAREIQPSTGDIIIIPTGYDLALLFCSKPLEAKSSCAPAPYIALGQKTDMAADADLSLLPPSPTPSRYLPPPTAIDEPGLSKRFIFGVVS